MAALDQTVSTEVLSAQTEDGSFSGLKPRADTPPASTIGNQIGKYWMRRLINIIENAQGKAFYHGTSTDQANYLAQHGFGTDHRPKGMSSAPDETRKFTCLTPSKATGIWYASRNLKHTDGGAVVQVRFDARPYVVRGHSDIYKAFAQAGKEFGVARHEDGQLDMTGIADALVAKGYNAVAFKDSWSSGRATLAVLTPKEISYVRRV